MQCFLLVVADAYLARPQRSAAFEAWLGEQAALPSFGALSQAALPAAASLFSLHRRAIRPSPAYSFAAVFFALESWNTSLRREPTVVINRRGMRQIRAARRAKKRRSRHER